MQLKVNSADLKANLEDSLFRAIIISVFTWRRADDTDSFDGVDKQGWWGDTYPDNPGDRIGSKLWQFFRQKITDETLEQIQECITNSLNWLVDDGICSNVNVTCERTEDVNRIDCIVELTQNNKAIKYSFEDILNG